MRHLVLLLLLASSVYAAHAKIDRRALLERNNPHINSIDTLASLSVGNGEFAFTCDVTGLQTFHQQYRNGVPLGTMAQWGWHSFPNTEGFTASDALRSFDFGRGNEEWYSCQFKTGREKDASDYLRCNPHRLHLGIIAFDGIEADNITDIDQQLKLFDGIITSSYRCDGHPMRVVTSCHPERDLVVAQISDSSRHPVSLLFPYPTGKHSDDACDWSEGLSHHLEEVSSSSNCIIIRHVLDGQSYCIRLSWQGASRPSIRGNRISINPVSDKWVLEVEFTPSVPTHPIPSAKQSLSATTAYWHRYWLTGGMVDMSRCTDPRAAELERRIVLSQYLLAIQCAGTTPPQETGLTYNSWFGKFHLEMTWWHQAQFALWSHPELLLRTLPWYHKAAPMARQIAERQGMEGIRWMKMTDPSAGEAPSNVGSFLIWQQPHLIYLCELAYRATHDESIISSYADLVEQSAQFMASFATYDAANDRYTLRGCIPAQETLKAAETINPPFELSYWHFGLQLAQEWRIRAGKPRNASWDKIIDRLSHLSAKDGVYAAAETAESYNSPIHKPDLALYSDHMAVLAALGVLPRSPQIDTETMRATLQWVMNHWNWDKTWGWDYPTTCMNATRLLEPELAIDALLMPKRTNTYLPNGHNYQDGRLRCYLPGNGGLLTAVALMCAGWDGCTTPLPGFPKDGKWDVRYEGILPMP